MSLPDTVVKTRIRVIVRVAAWFMFALGTTVGLLFGGLSTCEWLLGNQLETPNKHFYVAVICLLFSIAMYTGSLALTKTMELLTKRPEQP